MELDFIFEDKIKKQIENGKLVILGEHSTDLVRGLSLDNGEIWINLSALQWKIPDDDYIVNELGNTIVHETIHYLLRDVEADIGREESICRIMANQAEIIC